MELYNPTPPEKHGVVFGQVLSVGQLKVGCFATIGKDLFADARMGKFLGLLLEQFSRAFWNLSGEVCSECVELVC